MYTNMNGYDYILEVARTNSVSKAAEKLKISQPALSAHIKKIETQLGVPIFDRSQQPIKLTEAGAIYVEYAKKHNALNKELMQHLSDLGQLKTGLLTVGGASFFNVSYLPRAVSSFAKKYPGVTLEIIDGAIPEIIEKALNNEVDLFLAPSWKLDKRFHYEKILSEHIFICLPPAWKINDELKDKQIPVDVITSGTIESFLREHPDPFIDFNRLKKEPFVLLRNEQHIGHIMAELFVKYGFEPGVHTSVEQTLTSYALTLAGVGISLMTGGTIRNGHLKDYPIFYMTDPDICSRDMYVAYPKQKYLSRACKEFITILKKSLQTQKQPNSHMD